MSAAREGKMKAFRRMRIPRRLILSIATLLVGTMTLKIPELNAVHDELFIVIVTLALAVLGGVGIEVNGNGHATDKSVQPTDEELRGLIRLILIELLAEAKTEQKEVRND